MMYLVDTSVWINFLKQKETETVELLVSLLANPLACGINDQIYLELLQGARDQKAFNTLKKYFSGQRFYPFADTKYSHAAAAQIYLNCCRSGITIRSSIDCLIAQCAIEYKLILLHEDRDYLQMASKTPGLKQAHFLQT